MNNLLKNYTILDFSHRLPGPLAGLALKKLGAKVIKIEDQVFGDPFLSGAFKEFDNSFIHWYEELNEGKEIKKLDFDHPLIKDQINELLLQADGIILALPPKVKQKLGLDIASLGKLSKPIAVVELGASSTVKQSMHDLNALALSGMLDLHVHDRKEDIIDPPFLPVSGIAFGQNVATQLLAGILESHKTNKLSFSECFLHDTTEEILAPFWPTEVRKTGRRKFLHNGIYPCYSIYRTKDNKHVAIAAVEDKFWEGLCKIFPIQLVGQQRFDTKKESFEHVASFFKEKTSQEISEMTKDLDLCLSIIN
jgi:crotonobetainyl-CoA:carnitine CoA-transferase CaiB-like acyl-CoA transferase